MSQLFLICPKAHDEHPVTVDDIEGLSRCVMPDNIVPESPLVIEQDGIIAGALNPNPSLNIQGTSICAGHILEPAQNWWEPLSPLPDGAYAMFRSNRENIELATDIVASRTIWYVQTESLFIASTSQRIITGFLNSFELNHNALLWMLSSGNLGLGNSWDRRIKALLPDSTLHLDRKTWKLKIEKKEAEFVYTRKTEEEYKKELIEAIDYSFSGLSLDYSEWTLLLSGGLDSRGILLKQKDRENLNCLIFGDSLSLKDKQSDSYIASRLAEYYKLPYRFYDLELSGEPLETIFNRFISASEGRTDNISHNIDGFQLWKSLHESGLSGVIKGDEVFGGSAVIDEVQARQHQGVWVFQDYTNLNGFTGLVERQFGKQLWPDELKRREKETVDAFRDRLFQEFQPSVEFAAWNYPRYSYVEIINPLISRRIVEITRTLPDSLRTNKILFRNFVNEYSPRIPYAKHSGIPDLQSILNSSASVDVISGHLNSRYFRELFSDELINYIIQKHKSDTYRVSRTKSFVKDRVKSLLPAQIKNLIRSKVLKTNMNYSQLAFRMYLAGKSVQMFNEDAKLLAEKRRPA